MPTDELVSTFAIRQHVADVAERLERELGEEQSCFIDGCQHDWDRLPPPDGPLTVGIDGGFIRAPRKEGHFEVIAGKSMLSFQPGNPWIVRRGKLSRPRTAMSSTSSSSGTTSCASSRPLNSRKRPPRISSAGSIPIQTSTGCITP